MGESLIHIIPSFLLFLRFSIFNLQLSLEILDVLDVIKNIIFLDLTFVELPNILFNLLEVYYKLQQYLRLQSFVSVLFEIP